MQVVRVRVWYVCVCRGLKYYKVVFDWLKCGPVQNHTRWRTFVDSVWWCCSFGGCFPALLSCSNWFPNIWQFEGYSFDITDIMVVFFWVDWLLDGSCFPIFLKVQYFLMFSVKVMIVFPSVLYSATLFTCRLDGFHMFVSSYIQCSFCFSHINSFAIFQVTKILRKKWDKKIEHFVPL